MATNDESLHEPMELDEYESFPAADNSSIPTTGNGMGPKLKIRKTRRGWGPRGKKANKSVKLTLFGSNANGIKSKKESLLNAMKSYDGPSCVLIQESKLRFPGTFKIQGYQIFEKTRKGLGGGLLTAIEESLAPVLISSGSGDIELLVIQILVGKNKIRIVNGYGPQETENKGKILEFWQELEKEIIDAKEEGCMILIEMDANAKLGSEIIKDDPNAISDNGKLLRDLLQRQNLTCLNAHELCYGAITRHRKTVLGDEKAVLDFIIVCDQLTSYFERMIVDEKRENILTKYATSKGVRIK